jgi:hypothetical protein
LSPFETYKAYLALKKHFSTESYDYQKYSGNIRAKISSFHKRKDRYFFERLSRQRKDNEIIDYFLSSFVDSTDPSKVWIGEIINSGSDIYTKWKSKIDSLSYVFEQDLRIISENKNILEYFKSTGSRHPKLIKDYLSGIIQLESLIILVLCLNLLSKYDQQFTDPVWTQISQKIKKYKPFLNLDLNKYKTIIRKILL